MRLAVALALAVTLGLAAVATQTRVPLKQDLEILTEGPMRADRVKDGLYVIRGPFLYCMRGCPPRCSWRSPRSFSATWTGR